MVESKPPTSSREPGSVPRFSWPLVLCAGCILVMLLALLLPRPNAYSPSQTNAIPSPATAPNSYNASSPGGKAAALHHAPDSQPAKPAAEIVAEKMTRFARSRREIAHAMVKKANVELPPIAERFFDAVDGGNWEDIKAARDTALKERRSSTNAAPGLAAAWSAIHETFGVAEEAHNWPPQNLLDYGNAVLGSLKPGMVYVGGTDPGRFIPTLMNETSDGERHVILTQNALADSSYLQYLGFLYGDRMSTLSEDDSQRAFKDYIADAQKRLAHDQDSPSEPKQIQAGEDVRITDGRTQVSGQVAVMMINEKLFQTLMDKNPDLSFALEESFPFKSTFANAVPLGPVMELRVPDAQQSFTADTAAQSVDYFKTATQDLLADPTLAPDSDVRKAYSKLISSQAGLLTEHQFNAAAEQDYQLALQLCPSSPEAVFRYINLLMNQQRTADAIPVAESAIAADPQNQQLRDLLKNLKAGAAR